MPRPSRSDIRQRLRQTRVSLPLDAIRRPRNTPIWKLEAALKCRSCRTPRYSPPVHMIKLTKEREIAPYSWVHPDEMIDGSWTFPHPSPLHARARVF
jgi:hypothetical protein